MGMAQMPAHSQTLDAAMSEGRSQRSIITSETSRWLGTPSAQAAGVASTSAPSQQVPESFQLHMGRLHPDSELRRMFGSRLAALDQEDEDPGMPCSLADLWDIRASTAQGHQAYAGTGSSKMSNGTYAICRQVVSRWGWSLLSMQLHRLGSLPCDRAQLVDTCHTS